MRPGASRRAAVMWCPPHTAPPTLRKPDPNTLLHSLCCVSTVRPAFLCSGDGISPPPLTPLLPPSPLPPCHPQPTWPRSHSVHRGGALAVAAPGRRLPRPQQSPLCRRAQSEQHFSRRRRKRLQLLRAPSSRCPAQPPPPSTPLPPVAPPPDLRASSRTCPSETKREERGQEDKERKEDVQRPRE